MINFFKILCNIVVIYLKDNTVLDYSHYTNIYYRSDLFNIVVIKNNYYICNLN